VTPKNPCVRPAAPTGLRANNQTSETVSLQWNPVAGEGVNKITGYQVEMCEPGGNDWFPVEGLQKSPSLDVTGLRPNKAYKFRVKAKNSAGFGPGCIEELNVQLKPDYVKPDAPGIPAFKKVGKNFVELTWEAPLRNGGAKITGYVVEKRQTGSDLWSKATAYNPIETECRVDDLIENGVYEFRVKAVNKAGESEPSSSSGSQKISEYPNGVKPEFTKEASDAEGITGKDVSFSVDFDGSPAPEATWFKSGFELTNGKRYTIKQDATSSTLTIHGLYENEGSSKVMCVVSNPLGRVSCEANLRIKSPPRLESAGPADQDVVQGETLKLKLQISGKGPFDFKLKKDGVSLPEGVKFKVNENDGTVTLTIPNVSQEEDEGRYVLEIASDAGGLNVPFKLKVRAPPGPPQGPLNVSNIKKNSCSLSWKPPTTDGGSRVTHYTVEKRDCSKSMDSWVPCADTCRDHTIDVHGLRENGEYEFRVMAVNQFGHSTPLNTETNVVAKLPYGVPSAPGVPDVQEIGSDFVSLHWTKPVSEVPITGYYIEKQEKGTSKWVRCNYTPICITQFNIANLLEDHEYNFRVFAENEAGLSEPSSNSKNVLVKDPNAAFTPEFLTRLEDTSANEGKTAHFECEIKASPNTDVRFFKSGRELFSGGGKYHISNEGTRWTLSVNDVAMDDEDEYAVKAKNKSGSKMCRASLTVKCAPRIRLPERYKQTSTFEKDETIAIKIPFSANPKPSARWFKDGEALSYTPL